MARTKGNLIRGPLDVFIGPLGEALPEKDDLPPGTITVTPAGNWIIEGLTVKDENFKLLYTPTYEDILVNEATAAVDAALDFEAGSLGYMLSERDMLHWNRIMHASTLSTQAAGVDQTGQDILGIGHPASEPTHKSLLILGKNPEGGSRMIHVYDTLSVDPAEFAHGRKHTGTAILWRFFEDITQTLGERLFKIYDIVLTATS